MIKDIAYLKPESESEAETKKFFKFAHELARANDGKGCFSVTLYFGSNLVITNAILDYLQPFDNHKKLLPLGGYLWLINIEHTIDYGNESDRLLWYKSHSQPKPKHRINITAIEPS